MFENHSPAKYYLKKRNKKKYEIYKNFIQMRRKIIDDYCLYYLSDLFGIKFLRLSSSPDEI